MGPEPIFDLEKFVALIKEGVSKSEAAKRCRVKPRSINNLLKRKRLRCKSKTTWFIVSMDDEEEAAATQTT